MNKLRILSIFALSIVISAFLLSTASADSSYSSFSKPQQYFAKPYVYSNPSGSSAYASASSYSESPGYTQFPKETKSQKSSSSSQNSNFDSSSYAYDYRGPLYERKITYLDDFSKEYSDKGFFLFSNSKDILRHTISNTVTERYIGSTESLYINNQNRRQASTNSNQDSSSNYEGGFSYGKQRLFDSNEYAQNSYTSPYYYKPNYNQDQGYYNWRY